MAARHTHTLMLSLLLGGLSWGRAAEARPLLLVSTRDCPTLPRDEVARDIEAELGATEGAPDQALATRVYITCEKRRVILRVVDPLSRKFVRRSIDMAKESSKAQRRVIALAATELVLASWAELSINPTPQVEPEGPAPDRQALRSAQEVVERRTGPHPAPSPAPAETEPPQLTNIGSPSRGRPRRAPEPQDMIVGANGGDATPVSQGNTSSWGIPASSARLRLLAVVSTRGFLSQPSPLWGGGLRVGGDHLGVVAWGIDALYEGGRFRSGLGLYEFSTSTIGVSVSFLSQHELFTFRAGAGLRAGIARSSQITAGTQPIDTSETTEAPSEGSSVIAPWGWPSANVSVSCWAGPLTLDLSGEFGYAAIPLGDTAAGASGLAVRGAWAAAQVGIGFSTRPSRKFRR